MLELKQGFSNYPILHQRDRLRLGTRVQNLCCTSMLLFVGPALMGCPWLLDKISGIFGNNPVGSTSLLNHKKWILNKDGIL